jgi:hypothetical protein
MLAKPPPIGACLLCLARPPIRTLLVLVAVVAVALGWADHVRRRRLADDSGQFYTHEEKAKYEAFLEAVELGLAREAEQKAVAVAAIQRVGPRRQRNGG